MKIHYDKTMQMKATNFQQNMSASSNVPEIWRRVVCYCYDFLMLKLNVSKGWKWAKQSKQLTAKIQRTTTRTFWGDVFYSLMKHFFHLSKTKLEAVACHNF